MADAAVLNTADPSGSYGFESHLRHHRVDRIDDDEMVIDGHVARDPTKVWSVP